MSESSSNPQLMVPSPTPFCPCSSSSSRRKLRGTTTPAPASFHPVDRRRQSPVPGRRSTHPEQPFRGERTGGLVVGDQVWWSSGSTVRQNRENESVTTTTQTHRQRHLIPSSHPPPPSSPRRPAVHRLQLPTSRHGESRATLFPVPEVASIPRIRSPAECLSGQTADLSLPVVDVTLLSALCL